MTRPKFKSDARPSDTKSVVLHKENDKRLLDHLKTIKRESEWWRAAGNFYLDFTEWLGSQENAPEPNRPFVYYRVWLESRLSPSPSEGAGLDPVALSQVINDSLSAHLADVRQVFQTALENFTPPIPPTEMLGESDEVTDLLAGLDVALELEDL